MHCIAWPASISAARGSLLLVLPAILAARHMHVVAARGGVLRRLAAERLRRRRRSARPGVRECVPPNDGMPFGRPSTIVDEDRSRLAAVNPLIVHQRRADPAAAVRVAADAVVRGEQPLALGDGVGISSYGFWPHRGLRFAGHERCKCTASDRAAAAGGWWKSRVLRARTRRQADEAARARSRMRVVMESAPRGPAPDRPAARDSPRASRRSPATASMNASSSARSADRRLCRTAMAMSKVNGRSAVSSRADRREVEGHRLAVREVAGERTPHDRDVDVARATASTMRAGGFGCE